MSLANNLLEITQKENFMRKISARILALILCLATVFSALTVLSSCKKEDAEEKMTVIVENGASEYTIIRPDKMDKNLLDKVLTLSNTVREKCQFNIAVASDWVRNESDIDPNAKEILVGNTNRAQTKEVKDTLEPNSWAVVNKGNKIVICANNDALLPLAIDWFIENCIYAEDKIVKVAEKLVKTEGFGNDLPISLGGVSEYQVVYPKGNENLAYYASLIQREAQIANAVSDDKAAKDFEIVIGNTSRASAPTFSSDNAYSITMQGAKIFINAANEDVLYYAVNYYIEHGLTVKDSIVSAPADYEKSGKLDNYYKDKWDVNLPYFEEGSIAPVCNVGTGMADDREKSTPIETYIHVISKIDRNAYVNYGKKLESFGFVNSYSSKIENVELRLYRLGAAYAYVTYEPRLNYIRVIWDKSSNCEVSDIEYVSEQTGTTTFYQYSINYGYAAMNYTGINGWGLFNVVKLQDNSLIMMDGGSEGSWDDASLQGLCDFLYDITGTDENDPLRIRMWYFTHSDSDHTGLSHKLLPYMSRKGYEKPIIDAVAFNFPSNDNVTNSKDGSSYSMIDYFNKNYPGVNYLKLHTGMVFNLGELKIEVLGTVDNCVNYLRGVVPTDYNTNCTSTVIRLWADNKSILVTGDLGRGNQDHLVLYSENFWKSDVLQISHHGINRLDEIYERCAAQYALIPNSVEEMRLNRSNQYAYYLTLVPKSKLHCAGDYTTAVSISGGKLTVTKIPRFDNPTGKI